VSSSIYNSPTHEDVRVRVILLALTSLLTLLFGLVYLADRYSTQYYFKRVWGREPFRSDTPPAQYVDTTKKASVPKD